MSTEKEVDNRGSPPLKDEKEAINNRVDSIENGEEHRSTEEVFKNLGLEDHL
jgi:hypothetical protein